MIRVGDLVEWKSLTTERVWVGRVLGFYGKARDGVIVKDRLGMTPRPVALGRLRRVGGG